MCKAKFFNFLQENIRDHFYNLSMGKELLDKTQRAQTIEEKFDIFNVVKSQTSKKVKLLFIKRHHFLKIEV